MRALSRLKSFDHLLLLAPAPFSCAVKLARAPIPTLKDFSSSILNVAPALALADQSIPARNTPSGTARLAPLRICLRTSAERQTFIHIILSRRYAPVFSISPPSLACCVCTGSGTAEQAREWPRAAGHVHDCPCLVTGPC